MLLWIFPKNTESRKFTRLFTHKRPVPFLIPCSAPAQYFWGVEQVGQMLFKGLPQKFPGLFSTSLARCFKTLHKSWRSPWEGTSVDWDGRWEQTPLCVKERLWLFVVEWIGGLLMIYVKQCLSPCMCKMSVCGHLITSITVLVSVAVSVCAIK